MINYIKKTDICWFSVCRRLAARSARGDNEDIRVLPPRKTCKDECEQQSDDDNGAGIGNFVVNTDMLEHAYNDFQQGHRVLETFQE